MHYVSLSLIRIISPGVPESCNARAVIMTEKQGREINNMLVPSLLNELVEKLNDIPWTSLISGDCRSLGCSTKSGDVDLEGPMHRQQWPLESLADLVARQRRYHVSQERTCDQTLLQESAYAWEYQVITTYR